MPRQGAHTIPCATFKSHIRSLTSAAQERVKVAFDLGEKAHRGQTRKSGEPYFNHCIAIAEKLCSLNADADSIIAALLHDTVEDTDLTFDAIESQFGRSVRMIIDGLTKLRSEDFEDRPSLDNQIETLRKIFILMQEDVRIMVIKLVDRLHNMQTVEFLPEARQKSLAKETMEVYVKIADRLCMQDMRDELEELCIALLEPALFEHLLQLRLQNEEMASSICVKIDAALKALKPPIPSYALYENKSMYKLRLQWETGGSAVTGISAVTLVFVCESVPGCYRMLGGLHQCYKRETLSFQDFINAPRINGYQGLHTTVILEDGTRVRCKIRTREMHEYARRGVMTMCFDDASKGLPEYLPWANRISPLATGTMDRSDDFWESLQSDILGESITVYGPGDQAMLLPDGSTVLDGAFYFIGNEALKVKKIIINGKEVSLQTPLENAATLEVELGRKLVSSRSWLSYVRTGFAISVIREGLAQEPRDKKISEGKRVLEQMMIEKKRGLLVEFAESGLHAGMQKMGFDSVEDGYMAIAEGKIDVSEVYATVFPLRERRQKLNGDESKKIRSVVRFSIHMSDSTMLKRMFDIYAKHEACFGNMRVWPLPFSQWRRCVIHADLSAEEAESLKKQLLASGADSVIVEANNANRRRTLGMLSIVLLWGLDPVMASALLRQSVSVYDLTAIRFVVFFLFSAGLYSVHLIASAQKLKPISPFQPSLILSGVALFMTGASTYIALSFIPPIQYILLIVAGGITFSSLLRAAHERREWISPAIVFVVCIASVVLLTRLQYASMFGILMGFLSGLCFGFYTEVSRRYQEEVVQIHARYPAYLFWLSLIALVCATPFFFFTQFTSLPWQLIALTSAFVAVFIFLPYALYYMLVRSIDASTLDQQLLFVCAVTMIGEMIVSHSLAPLAAFPVLMALLWWEHQSMNQMSDSE